MVTSSKKLLVLKKKIYKKKNKQNLQILLPVNASVGSTYLNKQWRKHWFHFKVLKASNTVDKMEKIKVKCYIKTWLIKQQNDWLIWSKDLLNCIKLITAVVHITVWQKFPDGGTVIWTFLRTIRENTKLLNVSEPVVRLTFPCLLLNFTFNI